MKTQNPRRFAALTLLFALACAGAGIAAVIPPFFEDFEESEGYRSGPIEESTGDWRVPAGEVEITGETAYSGEQSVRLLAEEPPSEIEIFFDPYPEGEITFVDFFILPSSGDAGVDTGVDLGGVRLRFAGEGDEGLIEYEALSGRWVDSGIAFPAGEEGVAAEWIRLTFRIDYETESWDLYVNNIMRLFDRPLLEGHFGFLDHLSITGHPVAHTLFDYVFVGSEHPVFGNQARDGIDDAFKQEHSLALDTNVRDEPLDGARAIERFYEQGMDEAGEDEVSGVWIPFFEDFEQRSAGSIHEQGGWMVSGEPEALVQEEEAFRGMRALRLVPGEDGAVSHDFLSDHARVWVDFRLQPAFRSLAGAPEIPPFATSAFFFDASGLLRVFDGVRGEWIAAGEAGRSVRGGWTAVTLLKDYETQSWSVWVDSVLAAEGLGFANPAESFSRFHIAHALEEEALLDDIAITTAEPRHLDDDGDGLPNWLERELGSDPRNPDTSGDGLRDDVKVLWGRDPLAVSDPAQLPETDTGAREFEERFQEDAFSPGDLAGQRGWEGAAAEVRTGSGEAELRAALPAREGAPATMTRFLESLDKPGPVWTTLKMRLTPGPLPDAEAINDPAAALVAADRFGFLHAYDGEAEAWVPVDESGVSPEEWRRIDIKLNYQTKRWRLCIDGELIDGVFGFRDPSLAVLSRFQVRGAGGASDFDTEVETVRVSTVEPGDLDFSGDGMTNAEKRALGLDVYHKDTDRDGIPDWWELEHGLDPRDRVDAHKDYSGDGFSNLMAYRADVDPFATEIALTQWDAASIGAGLEGAAYKVEDGLRVVSSRGWMLLGRYDRFFFTYRELSGDFRVTARLRDVVADEGVAGLMVRESLEAESVASALLVFEDGHYYTGSRRSEARQGYVAPRGRANPPRGWMRIERRGDRFLHFVSEDGNLWRPIGEVSIPMSDTVLVGAGAASGEAGDFWVGDFDVPFVEALDDETDWVAGEGEEGFDSFAWMGEWDGVEDPQGAYDLREPSIDELNQVGIQTPVTREVAVAEANLELAGGEWEIDGSSLVSLERRGWIDLDVEIGRADLYLIEVEGRENNRFNRRRSGFELKLFLGDEYLGTRVLEAGYRDPGSVHAFTPWLSEGTHRLRILWDGSRSATHLQLDAVRLRSVGGGDGSGNGIRDWVEDRLSRQSGIDRRPMMTHVSPLRIEGRDRFNSLMAVEREALLVGSEDNHRDTARAFEAHPRGPEGWDLAREREALASAPPASVNGQVHTLPAGTAEWTGYLESWNAAQAVVPGQGAGRRFHAAVPLAPLVDNAVTVGWQDGVAEERFLTRWVPYNVIEGGQMVLGTGDSLLLTAGGGPREGEPVTLSVNGETYETTREEPLVYTFDEPGDYVIEGTVVEAGTEVTGELVVTVYGFDFEERPIAYAGRYRDWEPGEASGGAPLFEADPRLKLTEAEAANPRTSLQFGGENNVLKTIAARAGEDGPFLDLVEVETFRLFSSWETYLEVVDTLPDGSQLVEMMMILSPVPADVKLRLEIFVGGVVFEDGSLEKELTAEDFDELGQVRLRFLMPEEAKTSICHKTYVYQNDELIGVR